MAIKWSKRYGVAGATETVTVRDGRGAALGADAGLTGKTLLCNVWPGDDRTVTTTLPASWNDVSVPNFDVTFPKATMEALDVGFYAVEIKASDGSVDIAAGELRVTQGPGSGTARPTYHSYQDLEDELPWIGECRDYMRDQSGFAEINADARDWLDNAILKAQPTGNWGLVSRQNYWTWNFSNGGGNWSNPTQEDKTIRDALANDQLNLTNPGGRMIVKAGVYYALGSILARCLGMNTARNVNALAGQYLMMANTTLAKCVAEIYDDPAGDYPIYVIDMRATNTRFG